MHAFGLQRVKIGKVSIPESDKILWLFFCQIYKGNPLNYNISEERSMAWWKGRFSIQGWSLAHKNQVLTLNEFICFLVYRYILTIKSNTYSQHQWFLFDLSLANPFSECELLLFPLLPLCDPAAPPLFPAMYNWY